MTTKTAIIQDKDDPDWGKEGVIVAEEGEQSKEQGIVPEGYVELSLASPFASSQVRLVEKENLETYEMNI